MLIHRALKHKPIKFFKIYLKDLTLPLSMLLYAKLNKNWIVDKIWLDSAGAAVAVIKSFHPINHCFKNIYCIYKFPPVLVAPSAYVFHCSETAGDASKAVKVIQDGATSLQVIGVSCCLVQLVREQ